MQQKAITKIFDKTAGCKRLAVLFLYINKTLILYRTKKYFPNIIIIIFKHIKSSLSNNRNSENENTLK